MEIITGFTGIEHVTSADDASLYRGIIGQGDYVLDIGSKLEATIIDNNTIKIMDGDLLVQGHQARIRANDYEEVTINNGTLGKKRHDLIVARYTKNTDTGVEKIELAVIQGEVGDTAQDPSFLVGDISQGATIREYPIYRVKLDGLSIVAVEKLFDISKTLKDFDAHLAESASKHITESGSNPNGRYIKFDDGTAIAYLSKDIIASGTTVDYGNIPYPLTFTTTPIITASKSEPNSQTWSGNIHVGIIGPSAARIVFTNVISGNTYRYNLIVMGRWKQ